MRSEWNINKRTFLSFTAILVWLASLQVPLSAGVGFAGQEKNGISNKQSLAVFIENVNQYARLQEQLEKKLPKLTPKSEPEEIKARQTALEEAVRAARVDARPGDLFNKGTADHIRRVIREEFKGTKRQALRATIRDENTQGIPLKVNYPYPDAKAYSTVLPALLLKLPLLPKTLEYRFVGRHLILLDKKADLILDFMLNAVP